MSAAEKETKVPASFWYAYTDINITIEKFFEDMEIVGLEPEAREFFKNKLIESVNTEYEKI